ncbi:heparinase II/III domain-containing protein [Echinicola strongylocentroti]|nr:heparinase II/III family protein [Echinicola strongylocentroti]
MIKVFYSLVIGVLMLGWSQHGYAQKRQYLLHTADNIERLKTQVENDDKIADAWEDQLRKAEQVVKSDRQSASDCQVLALAYRMTGREAFAEKIREILLANIDKDTWESQGLLNRTPSWKGGLRTSHTSFFLSLGFDAAYEHLSEDDKQKIAKGIVRLGIKPQMENWLDPETSFHTFDTMGHNWWSACVYMAGLSAIAVRNEIPEAERWIEEIAGTAGEWIGYSGSVLQNKIPTFDQDGGFYESINYAAYGVSQYLLFRYALEQAMPSMEQEDFPILEKVVDFFIHTTYYVEGDLPLSVNFGDTNVHRNGNSCVVLLYNLGYRDDRYTWYLNQVNKGSDKEGLEVNSPNGLILYPDLPTLEGDYTPDLAHSHLYKEMDWATMRNSWENDATMLAVKSGFSWNHAHADAGSFILFHQGKNLIIDSGNSSYGNPLYTTYYCQSEAHNVILWDGKGQDRKDPYFGTVNHGDLHHLIDGDHYKYLLADASGPYAHLLRRNYRSFLWVGDVILVIDDLLAHQPGKFEWLLHYNGVSKRSGKDLSIKEGDAEVLVRPLFPETFPDAGLPHDFPEQMRLEEKMGYKDHEPENKVPYWSISHFEESARTKFVNAIVLKEDGQPVPEVEPFEGKDFLGVRITQGGEVTEVYFNLLADGRLKHRNSVINMNGWETDAYLTALTFDVGSDRTTSENVKKLFVGHGSYLRRDGQVMVHSLSKLYGEFGFDDDGKAYIDGQAGAKVSMNGSSFERFQVNGQSVNHSVDEESGLFTFRLSDK